MDSIRENRNVVKTCIINYFTKNYDSYIDNFSIDLLHSVCDFNVINDINLLPQDVKMFITKELHSQKLHIIFVRNSLNSNI